ncbi:MAG: nucleotidyltransferase domain-containing protein [Candidatus Thiodiazotropha sp. (ex Troendleina suluensis)]|nr:nucleotidyltransferase domain-containing protein [Candidatus Thiodiazotropha sp. (ex Troendleina suluensis)]
MSMPGCAVWLYGSRARGDEDTLSDVDILVVSDSEVSEGDILQLIPKLPVDLSVSRYSWQEVSEMADYGSLFLHHLRTEGRVLWEAETYKGELSRLLSGMDGYKHAHRDVSGFLTVLDDVNESIQSGGILTYELAVLGTVLRHSSILGCWLNAKPCFGRIEPVKRVVAEYGLNPNIATGFSGLYEFRLYVDGRVTNVQEPSHDQADEWLSWVREVVNAVATDANGYH